MKCEDVQPRLSLYVYGELSADEAEALGQHLESCADCRRELERERAIHGMLFDATIEPPPGTLARCRLDLGHALDGVEAGRFRWWNLFHWPVRAPAFWFRPLGAVALVAVGFFAARFTASETGPGRDSSPGEIARHVRYVEPGPGNTVKVVVDETRQRAVSGTIADASIRRLLLAALREPGDPGVRAESVDLLGTLSDAEEVRDALLYAAKYDPNEGVRLKALHAIEPYATEPRSRQALSHILLTDGNPGIRSVAVDMLIRTRQDDVVETLQDLLEKEDDSYVRMRSQNALRAMSASFETF